MTLNILITLKYIVFGFVERLRRLIFVTSALVPRPWINISSYLYIFIQYKILCSKMSYAIPPCNLLRDWNTYLEIVQRDWQGMLCRLMVFTGQHLIGHIKEGVEVSISKLPMNTWMDLKIQGRTWIEMIIFSPHPLRALSFLHLKLLYILSKVPHPPFVVSI